MCLSEMLTCIFCADIIFNILNVYMIWWCWHTPFQHSQWVEHWKCFISLWDSEHWFHLTTCILQHVTSHNTITRCNNEFQMCEVFKPPCSCSWLSLFCPAIIYMLWYLIPSVFLIKGSVFVCSSVQTNRSLNFLDNRSPQHPFFMMLSPPAPHSPWTAAPQYQKEFADVKAPRDGSFDKPGTVCPNWHKIHLLTGH